MAFVGDGLARPVTINKSRIVWRCTFVFCRGNHRSSAVRRYAFVMDAQCAPLQVCAFFVCGAVGVYFRDVSGAVPYGFVRHFFVNVASVIFQGLGGP